MTEGSKTAHCFVGATQDAVTPLSIQHFRDLKNDEIFLNKLTNLEKLPVPLLTPRFTGIKMLMTW
jgi:hypothetical protein